MLIERTDDELVEAVRGGDIAAFGELWGRHRAWALRTAGTFTRWREHDDVVSEAYTRTLGLLRDGRGPRGPFRPYLYVVMRNLAMELETARRPMRDIDEVAAESGGAEGGALEGAWNRQRVFDAFRSLPEQWRRALWHTEVEGMSPRELARDLGISANGAAALTYRAREGLREAWLRGQLGELPEEGECRWAVGKLPAASRGRLRGGDSRRLSEHLAACAPCRDAESALDGRGPRGAGILLPPFLAVLVGRWAGALGNGASASAATGSLAAGAPVAGAAIGGTLVTGLATAAVVASLLAGPAGEIAPPPADPPHGPAGTQEDVAQEEAAQDDAALDARDLADPAAAEELDEAPVTVSRLDDVGGSLVSIVERGIMPAVEGAILPPGSGTPSHPSSDVRIPRLELPLHGRE